MYEEKASITIGRKVTPPVEGIYIYVYMYKHKFFNLLKTPARNKKLFIGWHSFLKLYTEAYQHTLASLFSYISFEVESLIPLDSN